MILGRTLGPVALSVDGRPAQAELLWRKNVALLVYLARSPRRTRTREHLIGLLWADKPESAGRQSLNEALRIIRKVTGEEGLKTDATQVGLLPDAITLDTDQLHARLAAGDWAGAAAVVSGDFLEGFSVPGASEFEDWLASERSAVRSESLRALTGLAERQLSGGDLNGAAETAQRAAALEPTYEPALRVAMRSLALSGDRAGALERYESFAQRLADTLGAKPDAEAEALAERIRKERRWHRPPEAQAGSRQRSRAPLIGRESELRQAMDTWRDTAESRRASVVVLEGDHGLGKTRLLEEVTGRVRLDGAVVTRTRAVEADAGIPGSLLLGLARGGLLAAPGVAAASPVALGSMAARVAEWAERFPAADSPAMSAHKALGEIIRAVAEEAPLLLALDDAQWADGESLKALTALVRDLSGLPVCLVLAAAPTPPRPELELLRSQLGRDVPGARIAVEPLSNDALRALARWALPGYSELEGDRLARRIATDSAGYPLIAVELLQAVALGMDLAGAGAAWPAEERTLSHTLPVELPDTMVAAVRVRFRRMSAEAQQVLIAAAVLDGPSSAGRLARVTGLGAEKLAEALDEGEWERWLDADAQGYFFPARIVKEIIASDLVTKGQRQRIQEAAP
jgi:DNA-binding SARP family transcriptional activator